MLSRTYAKMTPSSPSALPTKTTCPTSDSAVLLPAAGNSAKPAIPPRSRPAKGAADRSRENESDGTARWPHTHTATDPVTNSKSNLKTECSGANSKENDEAEHYRC